jgi:cell division protein FtsB
VDNLEKINFEPVKQKENQAISEDSPPGTDSSMTLKNRFKKLARNRKFQTFLVVLILFLVIVGVQSYFLFNSASATYAQANLVVAAVKNQDVATASDELAKTREKLSHTQNSLRTMIYLKFIPGAHWYYNDAEHLVNGGLHGIDAAVILVDSVEPYADLLGLKGQGSFSGGTAEQRIQTAVQTMGKITPNIDEIADKLSLAQKEIDQVNPSHYPAIGPGKKVRNGLENLKVMADQGVDLINSSRPLIKILPELLGEPDEKKYLILFQNDKELRPTGGFLTAYSYFRIDRGVIHVDGSDNIYTLDSTIPGKSKAPEVIQKYLEVENLNIRDSNLSPDFKVSMDDFNKMYERSSLHEEVDGIIAVDTHALISAINILGSIEVDGVKFSPENDPRCECPQAIYQLEAIVDRPIQADFRYVDVNAVTAARKGIIGDLMYAIMEKAFSSSPKEYWGPLFQAMLTQMNEKHILFYMNDEEAQRGLEAFNSAGRIHDFEGDYLHINQANLGGAKSNMFVTQDVVQDYKVGEDGTITKTLTINYKNPHPPSDCNLERGNLCLNAVLRDWIRIYVPKGSKMIDSQGSEVTMKTYDELGKTVFEGFLTVRPRGTAKFTIEYRLPFKLAAKSSLPLMIQKQPGTIPEPHKITLGGNPLSEFTFTTDRTLNLEVR